MTLESSFVRKGRHALRSQKIFDPANMRRQITRAEDIDNLELMINKEQFDWEQRYNLKYILQTAEDFGLNKSRLNKAVETLDYEKRLVKNKLQRHRDDQKRKEKFQK